jgi:hypothetical protein
MVYIIKLLDEIPRGQWVNLKKSYKILECVRVDIYVHGSKGGCVSQSSRTCLISLHFHIYCHDPSLGLATKARAWKVQAKIVT